MSQLNLVDGHSRRPLVSQNNASITTGGSADFGQYDVSRYSRFTGMYSTVGSLTLRIRSGVDSGAFQVTSAMAVNSGIAVFDMLNFGRFAYLDITQARSTQYSLLFLGEPLR